MPFSWLATTLQSRRTSSNRLKRDQTRRRRIALESLEDRTLLSTFTWTGTNGADWSTPGNWSAAGVPGQYDDVVFDGSSSVDSQVDINFKVKTVTIASDYAGTVSLNAGANLTDTSGFTQAGGKFIVGTSTLTSGKSFTVSAPGLPFNAGSGTGTVVFDASTYGPGPIRADNVTFNNVIINYGSNHLDVGDSSLGEGLHVNGDLTINGVQQLKGVIYANRNVTTNQYSTYAMYSATANDKIIFGEYVNATLSAGLNGGTLPNVKIARAIGTLTISGNLKVSGSWTHETGIVNAAGSTVTFTGGGPVDSNTMAFGNVVIDSNTHFYVKKLKVGGDLTLQKVFSLNYTGGAGSGAITVAGDLTSNDSSVPTVVGAPVDITMIGSGDADITGGDFPTGGIIVARSGSLNANVTTALRGPLVFNTLFSMTGEFKVGGNVTTNDASITGAGVIDFAGTGLQKLNGGANYGMLPNIKISTGPVQITSNTLAINGNWDGSNFNAGTSTVKFTGYGAASVDAGSTSFNNVIVNRGGSLEVTNAGGMNVAGSLKFETMGLTSLTGLINAYGNVTTNEASIIGAGVIDFVGNGIHDVSGIGAVAGYGMLPNVRITSGTVNLLDTLSINGDWDYNGGTFNAGTSTVKFVGNGGNPLVNTGPTSFYNVEIARNGNFGVGDPDNLANPGNLTVGNDLTITNVVAINAPLGAITVGRNLTSTDIAVSGTADITMVGGSAAALKGGDFPDGGIVIKKNVSLGANFTNAAQTAPIKVSTGTLDLGSYTLQTKGAFTVDNGATLAFTTTGATQLTVGGKVMFASGSTINVTYGSGAGTYVLVQVVGGGANTMTDTGAIYVLTGVTSKSTTPGVNGNVSITV